MASTTTTTRTFRSVPATAGRGWAVYARLSRKKVGHHRSRRRETVNTDRQIAEIRAWAASVGIVIDEAHIYIDNNMSAWKKDGKRPGYDAMIAAARRNEFVGILVWNIDRFTRRTRDAIGVCDVAEERGGLIIDGPQSGRYDLSKSGGRADLREAASEAEKYSDDISEKVRSAHAGLVRDGLQLGKGRVYGFEKLSETKKGDGTNPVMEDHEVAILREYGQRALNGETWTALAADLNAKGERTSAGRLWQATTLRQTIMSPRYGGRIIYQGKIIGTRSGEHVYDEETYAKIQGLARPRGRQPIPDYPWTGLATCGRCGQTMVGGTRRTRYGEVQERYVCPPRSHGSKPGCTLGIMAWPIDDKVRDEVLRRAANPDLRGLINDADRAADAAREELRGSLGKAEGEIKRLNASLSRVEIRRELPEHDNEHLAEPQYKELRASLRSALSRQKGTRDKLLAELAATGPSGGNLPAITRPMWDRATAAQKRIWAERLHLKITVSPQRPGTPRNRTDPDRVVVE